MRVSTVFINFIYGKNHRHPGCLRMTDCFAGLRHYGIIRSNYNYCYICDLGAPGTHGSKCFVTRSIKKRNFFSIWQLHLVGTNMLCNATCFSCYHICISNIIQQRSFSMINMTHNGNNRRTWLQFIFTILIFFYLFHFHLLFHVNELYIITKFTGHQFNYFGIKTLVNGNHNTQAHTFADYIRKIHIH